LRRYTSALNKAMAKMDSSTAARVGEVAARVADVRATAAAAADGVRQLNAAGASLRTCTRPTLSPFLPLLASI
jgi:hypothetical protein